MPPPPPPLYPSVDVPLGTLLAQAAQLVDRAEKRVRGRSVAMLTFDECVAVARLVAAGERFRLMLGDLAGLPPRSETGR
jgi:hypothetical protein